MAKKDQSDKPVTVDMTDAATFELVPKGTKCLGTLSEWKIGKSQAGGNAVRCVVTILEPEKYKNRKVFTNTSIDNPYGKGTVMGIIMGALEVAEKDIRRADFAMPSEDDMVGTQIAFTAGIAVAKEGSGFSDQNTLTKIKPGDTYEAE